MAAWSIEWRPEAERDLAQLDRTIRRRVIDKVDWLERHFIEITPLTLGADFADFYKLRVGDWRIVYKTDWNAKRLVISYIDRRDKIYHRR